MWFSSVKNFILARKKWVLAEFGLAELFSTLLLLHAFTATYIPFTRWNFLVVLVASHLYGYLGATIAVGSAYLAYQGYKWFTAPRAEVPPPAVVPPHVVPPVVVPPEVVPPVVVPPEVVPPVVVPPVVVPPVIPPEEVPPEVAPPQQHPAPRRRPRKRY